MNINILIRRYKNKYFNTKHTPAQRQRLAAGAAVLADRAAQYPGHDEAI